jgi:hypothetical protein
MEISGCDNKLLRFADQDKKPNLCDVVYAYQTCKQEMESFFGRNMSTWNEYLRILDAIISFVYRGTYVGVGMYETSSQSQVTSPYILLLTLYLW